MWYILSMRFYLVFVGVFWHVVKPYLSDDDRERFSTLKNINSDIGRGQFSLFISVTSLTVMLSVFPVPGRAWLRTAINERTLENYLHTLLASVPHLKYVKCTFLCSSLSVVISKFLITTKTVRFNEEHDAV